MEDDQAKGPKVLQELCQCPRFKARSVRVGEANQELHLNNDSLKL